MIIYKGWKFILLGMQRWRVIPPEWYECSYFEGSPFDVIFRSGVKELIARVNLWEEVLSGYNRP